MENLPLDNLNACLEDLGYATMVQKFPLPFICFFQISLLPEAFGFLIRK